MDNKPESNAGNESTFVLEEGTALGELPLGESPLGPAPVVGECTAVEHPTLLGRVRVRWQTSRGAAQEHWLPCMHGVTVRVGDRVLLQRPSNFPEAVVLGVLDGFSQRPEMPRTPAAQVQLQRDETVRIVSEGGVGLVELRGSDTGPIVRLLSADVQLEVPGSFRLAAKSIALEAQQGEVTIEASDDVVVLGEFIRLN